MIKRVLLLTIFLLSGIWSSVQAGTEYEVNDSSETTSLGLLRYTNKVWMGSHVWTNGPSLTVVFDEVQNTKRPQVWHTADWGTNWDRMVYPGTLGNISEVDASFSLYGYGDTILYPFILDSTGGTADRFVLSKLVTTTDTITMTEADTLDVFSGSSPTRLAGMMRAGSHYQAILDVNGATTDSSRLYYSDGALAGATWTRVWDSTQVANAGLLIPVTDGSGGIAYWLKANMNTEELLTIDSLNKIKLAADSITQPSAGSAATDLQTPGYGSFDIIYLGADCYLMAFQKGLTSNKGIFGRSFKFTYTGSVVTGWTWISNLVQIGSNAPPDNWRYYPALSSIYGRRDTAFCWVAELNGSDTQLVRYMTTDTGKTWSQSIEFGPGARQFINIQAPDQIVSASGTIYTACFYETNSATATSSFVYGYLDTLYNPTSTAQPNRKALNTKAGRLNKNFKGGPHVANKK